MSERLSTPGDLAAATISAFQKEAASNKLYSELLVDSGHSLDDPYDDATTHQHMAEVYRSTAEKLGVTIKQFRRDLERAMNPHFKDYSDVEIDRVIERYDRTLTAINDHHGALT
jgi:hypothetical protein